MKKREKEKYAMITCAAPDILLRFLPSFAQFHLRRYFLRNILIKFCVDNKIEYRLLGDFRTILVAIKYINYILIVYGDHLKDTQLTIIDESKITYKGIKITKKYNITLENL